MLLLFLILSLSVVLVMPSRVNEVVLLNNFDVLCFKVLPWDSVEEGIVLELASGDTIWPSVPNLGDANGEGYYLCWEIETQHYH